MTTTFRRKAVVHRALALEVSEDTSTLEVVLGCPLDYAKGDSFVEIYRPNTPEGRHLLSHIDCAVCRSLWLRPTGRFHRIVGTA